MASLPAALLLLVTLLGATSAQQTDLQNSFYDCLTATGAELVLPSNASAYGRARQVANPFFSTNYPVAVVYAHSTEDVQQVVKCGAEASVRIIPRGGGHSVAGLAVHQGAVTLDLSRMDRVTVAPHFRTAVAEGGARLGQLYYHAYTASNGTKGFNAGLAPPVGVGGHILGGGIGYLARKYGLACDSLLGIKMVTAAGELVSANKTRHPELLWAACGGGGGTLGVVVEFTVRLVDVPPVVTTFTAAGPLSQGAEGAAWYQEWGPKQTRNLTTFFLFVQGVMVLQGQYLGPQAEAQVVLAEAQNAFTWFTFPLKEVTWLEAVLQFAADPLYTTPDSLIKSTGDQMTPQVSKSYMILDPLPEGPLQALQDFSAAQTGAWVAFQALGGAVAEVSPNATAYPWRDALCSMFYLVSWDNTTAATPAAVATGLAALSNVQAALSPYIPYQASYINYLDPNLADWPTAFWGANAQRLQSIKQRWDPTDFWANLLQLTTTQKLPEL